MRGTEKARGRQAWSMLSLGKERLVSRTGSDGYPVDESFTGLDMLHSCSSHVNFAIPLRCVVTEMVARSMSFLHFRSLQWISALMHPEDLPKKFDLDTAYVNHSALRN